MLLIIIIYLRLVKVMKDLRWIQISPLLIRSRCSQSCNSSGRSFRLNATLDIGPVIQLIKFLNSGIGFLLINVANQWFWHFFRHCSSVILNIRNIWLYPSVRGLLVLKCWDTGSRVLWSHLNLLSLLKRLWI